MATTTYVPIATTTLTGTQANIEFTSISGAYTDFILTGTVVRTAGSDIEFVLGNGSYDTGSNYSYTFLAGNGSSAFTGRAANQTKGNSGYSNSTNPMSLTIHAQNYSNTSTYKTLLVRNSPASPDISAIVNLWRSTSAINQIKLTPNSGSFGAGTSLTLYGIANSDIGAPKATGGIITYDNTYYYHTFGASGTFTPQQSLTADILVVAGGGGGGGNISGGGGAGGLRTGTLSLTAQAYSVTVGAGGTKGTGNNADATSGGNSVFSTITSAGGGNGAGNAQAASSGGSGGGGAGGNNNSGAAGNTPSTSPAQGNSGANGQGATFATGGGGGGAGASGTAGSTTANSGGQGGNGSLTYSSWGLATGTGENISGTIYYAGGGGGGRSLSGTTTAAVGGYGGGGKGGFDAGSPNSGTNGSDGLPNTGGGGGGTSWGSAMNGGNGGSGVVIVRYLK